MNRLYSGFFFHFFQCSDTRGTDSQFFLSNSFCLQIQAHFSFGRNIRMTTAITAHCFFTTNLTYFRHMILILIFDNANIKK